MSVADGSRLGPYEILSLIGSGGMGEVYRAHDARLGRDVAIKVLPREFTSDPDRLARLEREARALAALNHPNVASIYGVEEYGEARALVMELVDGELLAERIANAESGLPVKEALALARQLAAALDAAHDKGIVHRDLKPANIKVTSGGVVKVLDFGLAKSVNPAADALATVTTGDTLVGTVVGTPAYMSPEQARGHAIDRRTDVFAFGCILYEMLTGSSPFAGEDAADTLARVLRHDPDLAALPPSTPPGIRRLISLCLEKEPSEAPRADRRCCLRDRHYYEISPSRSWIWSRTSGTDPAEVSGTSATGGGVDASPDGRWVAYHSAESGQMQVYVQAHPGPGRRYQVSTDGGGSPVWRADGRELFYARPGGTAPQPQSASITMMAVPVALGAELALGAPAALFEGSYEMNAPARGYDVSADGERFFFMKTVERPRDVITQIAVIQNWFEELEGLVPVR